jgi:DNA-binding XRE family transcriptional regulator
MNEMVTIPREEYDRLRAAAEDLADLQSYDRANAALAAGADELIPSDYANRLLDGENPLRVYRDFRGLTQAMLAERAGVNRVTVAEIETGRKQGSIATLRALAGALDVTLDNLTE